MRILYKLIKIKIQDFKNANNQERFRAKLKYIFQNYNIMYDKLEADEEMSAEEEEEDVIMIKEDGDNQEEEME